MKKTIKKICICVIVIAVIALVCFAGFKFLGNKNKVGVTIGNNYNNYGYVNKQGKWIYYMSLSNDATMIDICRIDDKGKNKEVLVEKDWEIYSINVYDNYLYFIAFEEVTDDSMYQNNKIYKMSLDGSELRVINDNHFSDDCKIIYVSNDRVYYIGENYNIYSMDLEGGDRTLIRDNETGYVGVTDKYIFYNDYPENPESETDFVTYRADLDGSNYKIINGERLYNLNVVGDEIYYVNGENSEIHKIDVNGENDALVYKSPAYNMNVIGDYIYYLNYKNENADSEDETVCIHKVKTDGTDHQIICEMENYSSFIGLAGDWVYYTDHDDNNYYINLIKNDGSEEVELFNYSYGATSTETTSTEEE